MYCYLGCTNNNIGDVYSRISPWRAPAPTAHHLGPGCWMGGRGLVPADVPREQIVLSRRRMQEIELVLCNKLDWVDCGAGSSDGQQDGSGGRTACRSAVHRGESLSRAQYRQCGQPRGRVRRSKSVDDLGWL